MQAKFRHYIWDFDGTLYDSYPHIAHTFCQMMETPGRPVDYAEADALLRVSFLDARKKYGISDAEYTAFHARQREDFDPPILPYAESEAVLTALLDAGADHYIYTHRDKKSLCYYLEKYGFAHYFSGMVTADDGFPGKPAPDALLALLARYGLDANDCIMVGDREIDVGSGIAAGVATCLFDERKLAPETAADYMVTSLSEIVTL